MAEIGLSTTILEGIFLRYKNGDVAAKNELLKGVASRLEHLSRKLLKSFPEVRAREETDILQAKALVRLEKALDKGIPESLKHFFRLAAKHIRWELLEMKRVLLGRYGEKPKIVSLSDEKILEVADRPVG